MRVARIIPAAAGLLLLLHLLSGCTPSIDPERTALDTEPQLPVAESGETAPAEPEIRVTRALLGRRGTLDGALDKLEIPAELRPKVIAALDPHLDLRRLSPQTGLTVGHGPDDAAVFVACRPTLERYVVVDLLPDGSVRAESREVPVRDEVETAGGTVESTVAQALSGHPDAVGLTLAFADIFQWDVDLFVDPRPGDHVRLVYRSRELMSPPLELPRFGDSSLDEGARLGLGRILAASYEGARVSSTAYWIEGDEFGGDYYDDEGRSLRKTFLKSPLNYRRISSGFTNRRRHPITRRVVPHHGVDFVAAPGTPVVAAADGRVTRVGWQGALGRAVRIRHGSAYATVYGHLRGFAKGIRPGAEVRQNQVIGYVGATGRATGPHLHYTLLHHGGAVNPMSFRNPAVAPLDPSLLPRLEDAKRIWTPVLLSIRLDSPASDVAQARGTPAPPAPGRDG